MWPRTSEREDDDDDILRDMDVITTNDTPPLKEIENWVRDYVIGGMDEEESGGYTINRGNKTQEEIRLEEEAWRQTREHDAREVMEERARQRAKYSKTLPYFGDLSPTERTIVYAKTLLLPSRNTISNSREVTTGIWSQSPYEEEKTWRNREQISEANDHTSKQFWRQQMGPNKELFEKTYRRYDTQSHKMTTFTAPELYRLSPVNRQLFKELLVNRESDLIMKLTPLVEQDGQVKDDVSLAQIYNEIKIGFFLNELLYAYKHVLSIHFIVPVDWFQATRADLGLYAGPVQSSDDSLYTQCTVAEYAEDTLREFMQSHPTMEVLKGVIFQVLHALETAWITNEFIHYDLHMGNIMMKRTTGDESPLNGRNLLYKRYGHAEWYQLRAATNLGEHIVKIIDFGFSRIRAPSKPAHKQYGTGRHLHDRVIGLDWPMGDMRRVSANQYADVRLFLLDVLTLRSSVWGSMPDEDRRVFYEFVSDVLDFEAMNREIDKDEEARVERDFYSNRVFGPADVVNCPDCVTYLQKFHGYARSNKGNGLTASEVLDHPFFDSLRRAPLAHSEGERGKDDLVVSFFTLDGEEQMIRHLSTDAAVTTATPAKLYCVVCGEEAKHYNMEGKEAVPLCGAMCAEFKYIYGEKTIHR